MAKKRRPGAQPNPAIRLSSLGPRLAQLFPGLAADPATVYAELDRLTGGLKPSSFLPILVGVFATTTEGQREPLVALMSEWLQQHGLLEPLRDLEARHGFREPARSVARALLAAGGVSIAPQELADPADLFLAAYELGETSQDSPTLFWYQDERRHRVRSASFLVDFEPPWEGALKDIAYTSHRSLDDALGRYRALWQAQGLKPLQIDAATAAQRVWKALRQNQAQGIRLPDDFIAAMPQLLPFLRALPVEPGIEPLSAAEIQALATTGRNPESIRREEQLLGYQTRMPDGTIVRLMRPPDDEW
jgi:hypothetical protein